MNKPDHVDPIKLRFDGPFQFFEFVPDAPDGDAVHLCVSSESFCGVYADLGAPADTDAAVSATDGQART